MLLWHYQFPNDPFTQATRGSKLISLSRAPQKFERTASQIVATLKRSTPLQHLKVVMRLPLMQMQMQMPDAPAPLEQRWHRHLPWLPMKINRKNVELETQTMASKAPGTDESALSWRCSQTSCVRLSQLQHWSASAVPEWLVKVLHPASDSIGFEISCSTRYVISLLLKHIIVLQSIQNAKE